MSTTDQEISQYFNNRLMNRTGRRFRFNPRNFILLTDSYKIGHWKDMPEETEESEAYFEARVGATFGETVWNGLQPILIDLFEGAVITQQDIEEADLILRAHFGRQLLNREMWEYIVNECGGKLPIQIRAVAEGSVVPIDNVLMIVRNTKGGKLTKPLTTVVETILTHVWFPSTVASLSRFIKTFIKGFYEDTADDFAGLDFALHDFGFRGTSSLQSAAVGGCAHLINFLGTDTLPAMLQALNYYNADLNTLAYSVQATEHSIMSSMGRSGEAALVEKIINEAPDDAIVSLVGDTHTIYGFVKDIICASPLREKIAARKGRIVVRPDSPTPEHKQPEDQMLWIAERLWETFGGTVNKKGYKEIAPCVGILWGDGIDREGIRKIYQKLKDAGFGAKCIATNGMGGGLLQKVNRDTQRCAFKCCAQLRNGQWVDIFKEPLDKSKTSKRGRLDLIKDENGNYKTIRAEELGDRKSELVTVFENGVILKEWTFDEVRANAALK